jgi:hypothetical protein
VRGPRVAGSHAGAWKHREREAIQGSWIRKPGARRIKELISRTKDETIIVLKFALPKPLLLEHENDGTEATETKNKQLLREESI